MASLTKKFTVIFLIAAGLLQAKPQLTREQWRSQSNEMDTILPIFAGFMALSSTMNGGLFLADFQPKQKGMVALAGASLLSGIGTFTYLSKIHEAENRKMFDVNPSWEKSTAANLGTILLATGAWETAKGKNAIILAPLLAYSTFITNRIAFAYAPKK